MSDVSSTKRAAGASNAYAADGGDDDDEVWRRGSPTPWALFREESDGGGVGLRTLGTTARACWLAR
jgi:hypothetical protein